MLLKRIGKNHAVIRIRCVELADSLFQRSHIFRCQFLTDLESFLTLTLGHDPAFPLPPPVSQQRNLQRAIIKAIKEWHGKFAPAYKKLQLAFAALKETVDFDDLCL